MFFSLFNHQKLWDVQIWLVDEAKIVRKTLNYSKYEKRHLKLAKKKKNESINHRRVVRLKQKIMLCAKFWQIKQTCWKRQFFIVQFVIWLYWTQFSFLKLQNKFEFLIENDLSDFVNVWLYSKIQISIARATICFENCCFACNDCNFHSTFWYDWRQNSKSSRFMRINRATNSLW